MANGTLLLVDAYEGPMPQTRFVLQKSLERGLKPMWSSTRSTAPTPARRKSSTRCSTCWSISTPRTTCSTSRHLRLGPPGLGDARPRPTRARTSMPLFEAIVEPRPARRTTAAAPSSRCRCRSPRSTTPITSAASRSAASTPASSSKRQRVAVIDHLGEVTRKQRRAALRVRGPGTRRSRRSRRRRPVRRRRPGADRNRRHDRRRRPAARAAARARRRADAPHDVPRERRPASPAATASLLTSRQIGERLERELRSNVALRVAPGPTQEQFRVSGRGLMHLGILIENMRREGFELCVGKPQVIYREIDGEKCEPIEQLVVDCPDDCQSSVMALLGDRRAELVKMGHRSQHQRLHPHGVQDPGPLAHGAPEPHAQRHQGRGDHAPHAAGLRAGEGRAAQAAARRADLQRNGHRPRPTRSTPCTTAACSSSAPATRCTKARSSARTAAPAIWSSTSSGPRSSPTSAPRARTTTPRFARCARCRSKRASNTSRTTSSSRSRPRPCGCARRCSPRTTANARPAKPRPSGLSRISRPAAAHRVKPARCTTGRRPLQPSHGFAAASARDVCLSCRRPFCAGDPRTVRASRGSSDVPPHAHVRRRGLSILEFLGCFSALVVGVFLGSLYLGVDVKEMAYIALEQAQVVDRTRRQTNRRHRDSGRFRARPPPPAATPAATGTHASGGVRRRPSPPRSRRRTAPTAEPATPAGRYARGRRPTTPLPPQLPARVFRPRRPDHRRTTPRAARSPIGTPWTAACGTK